MRLWSALRGDASVLVPPLLGGDLPGPAGQVSDYLPSNMEQTGGGVQVEGAIYSVLP